MAENLSQTKLAAKAEMSAPKISAMENEPRNLTIGTLIRVGDVPRAFVDGDHFAGVAGDAAVGEEVGRVGEDEVDGGRRDFFQDVEAVAVVDAEVGFGVVENRSGQGGHWDWLTS